MIARLMERRPAVVVRVIGVIGVIGVIRVDQFVRVHCSDRDFLPCIKGAVGVTERIMLGVEGRMKRNGINDGKTQNGDHHTTRCRPSTISPRSPRHDAHFLTGFHF